ncbi:hypothetical protein AB0L57_25935 [Nocardia sp. NPDC052254]|uniref:hypothetical protein n=1 Tax=Nocardia sp. NPDC052254 TaxID=3155681 RepID=UPI0034313786
MFIAADGAEVVGFAGVAVPDVVEGCADVVPDGVGVALGVVVPDGAGVVVVGCACATPAAAAAATASEPAAAPFNTLRRFTSESAIESVLIDSRPAVESRQL